MTVVNNRRGVLREGVVGSKRWRQLMSYEITKAMIAKLDEGAIFPTEGSVGVSALFYLPTKDVIVKSSGDVDKLARNLLDALTDAQVYRDDVQVISLVATKVPAGEQGPGVEIHVYRY